MQGWRSLANTTDGRKIIKRRQDDGRFVFFSYLQKEKPDLLDFRGGVGSKWQIVHLWLRRAGRLEI